MADSGILYIQCSWIQVFTSDETKSIEGPNFVENLKQLVAASRELTQQRVEIVTTDKDFFKFSGKISDPLPRFDAVTQQNDFEARLKMSASAESAKWWSRVGIAVRYSIDNLADYIYDAKDEGEENPNLFSWIEYCISDAQETIRETLHQSSDLKSELYVDLL